MLQVVTTGSLPTSKLCHRVWEAQDETFKMFYKSLKKLK